MPYHRGSYDKEVRFDANVPVDVAISALRIFREQYRETNFGRNNPVILTYTVEGADVSVVVFQTKHSYIVRYGHRREPETGGVPDATK